MALSVERFEDVLEVGKEVLDVCEDVGDLEGVEEDDSNESQKDACEDGVLLGGDFLHNLYVLRLCGEEVDAISTTGFADNIAM